MTQEIVEFDLSMDEIALIIHTFLKRAKTTYQTMNFHVEESIRKIDEKNNTEIKYSLIIIASGRKLSKQELLNNYKRIIEANNKRFMKWDEK